MTEAAKPSGGDAASPSPNPHPPSDLSNSDSAASLALPVNIERPVKQGGWFSLLRSGNYTDGMSAFREAMQNGDVAASLEELEGFARLVAYEDGGVYQAFVDLEESARANLDNTDAWLWYGYGLKHAQRDQEAMDAMRHILARKANPSTRRACVNFLASYEFSLGNDRGALELWRSALRSEKDSRAIADYLQSIAAEYERESPLKDDVLATSMRELALDYAPANNDARLSLAWKYANELSAPSLALFHYLEVRGRDKNDGLAAINSGWVADRLALPITAVDHYLDAQGLQEVLAITNTGWLLLHAGFAAEAEKLVAEARRIQPQDEQADRLAVAIRDRRKDEANRISGLVTKARQVRGLRSKIARSIASSAPALSALVGTYEGVPSSLTLNANADGVLSGSFQMAKSGAIHVFNGELIGGSLRLEWRTVPVEPVKSSPFLALQIPSVSRTGRAQLFLTSNGLEGYSFQGSEVVDAEALEELSIWCLKKSGDLNPPDGSRESST